MRDESWHLEDYGKLRLKTNKGSVVEVESLMHCVRVWAATVHSCGQNAPLYPGNKHQQWILFDCVQSYILKCRLTCRDSPPSAKTITKLSQSGGSLLLGISSLFWLMLIPTVMLIFCTRNKVVLHMASKQKFCFLSKIHVGLTEPVLFIGPLLTLNSPKLNESHQLLNFWKLLLEDVFRIKSGKLWKLQSLHSLGCPPHTLSLSLTPLLPALGPCCAEAELMSPSAACYL